MPLDTIHHIRGLLKGVDVMPIEQNWINSARGFHSVTLNIPRTSLRTNGKGTTPGYALASAYGEMMERLQNLAPFRLGMDFKDDAFKDSPFMYAPDEVMVSEEEFIDQSSEWMKLQFKGSKKDLEELNELWKDISYEKVEDGFVGVPFLNLMTKNVSNIPIKMLNKIYMSNGMCAGNTREEALIQGIAEIFERHCNKQILMDAMSVPTIPRSYLKQYDRLWFMINQIESSGAFKIVIKDCSLGEGYPAVAVIFIDQATHKYFIKFGAFPKFDVALERTLTELLQGQDIKQMRGLSSFSFNERISDRRNNMIGIFVNGAGEYPKEFFIAKGEPDLQLWDRFNGKDSIELLEQVIDFVGEKDYQVFLRDVSYLGFPSYHVVIPGMSEVENTADKEALKDYIRYNSVKRHIRNLEFKDNNKIKELISLLESQEFSPTIPVTRIINVELKNTLPWYLSCTGLLKLALHVKIGDYKGAVKCLEDYIKMACPKNAVPSYYECLREYLTMKVEGIEEHVIYEYLGPFYDSRVVDQIIREFNPETIIQEANSLIKCFDCNNCKGKKGCTYIGTEKVYHQLLGAYGHNIINQKQSFEDLYK